jgi:hypothetical protein
MGVLDFFQRIIGGIGLCGACSLEAGAELLMEGHHNAGTAIMIGLGLLLIFFLLNSITVTLQESSSSSASAARPGPNSYGPHSMASREHERAHDEEENDDDTLDCGDFGDCGDF